MAVAEQPTTTTSQQARGERDCLCHQKTRNRETGTCFQFYPTRTRCWPESCIIKGLIAWLLPKWERQPNQFLFTWPGLLLTARLEYWLDRQKAPGLLQVPSPLSNDMNQVDGDVGGCIVADAGHWSLSKLGAWLHTVVAGCLIKMSLIPWPRSSAENCLSPSHFVKNPGAASVFLKIFKYNFYLRKAQGSQTGQWQSIKL